MGLLNSENGSSSMRFTLILTVVGAFLLMVAAAVYIVAAALVPAIAEPSWTEIGVFGVGLADSLDHARLIGDQLIFLINCAS